jgi:putative transposase
VQEACGDYYASILVDQTQLRHPVEPLVVTPETTVGLDVGLTDFIIDSRGNKIANPKFLKESLKALEVEQKKYARIQKGSHGQKKQKKVVATVHERIKNQRKNFIHQITAMLVKSQDSMFVLEDLNIKGMIKNRKLSRAIADVGWGMFISIFRYKCERSGKTLYQINRFAPTSKLCSKCGHKMDSMPLSLRDWDCPSCGCHHDRDVNAAKNIQAIGLADVLGHSICVKSPRLVMPVSAGNQETKPNGAQVAVHGSQEKEAPTRIVLAI